MAVEPTSIASQTDEQLVEGLRSGRAACADELIKRYWQPIHRFCVSYLSDTQLAEDVTQDTFAKLTSPDHLPEGNCKPWIYKLAHNRCLDILRRQQRSPTDHRPLRTGVDVPRQSSGPGTKAAREERRVLIREIVALMPDDYRIVLTLKHFEGLSRQEMAETLGVSEAIVKGRLVRASEYLRTELRKITGSGAG